MSRRQRRNHRGTGLILIGTILILSAVSLVGYNIWDSVEAERKARQAFEQLTAMQPEALVSDRYAQGNSNLLAVGQDTEQEIPDYVLNPSIEMPLKEVEGFLYIGTLEIPVLSLNLPVISEWGYPELKVAPSRYTGSPYQNNFVIAAHNYESHFGAIKLLQPGNAVNFTDMAGNQFRYKVAEVEILQPTSIQEMTSGIWDLTLFTCTIGGQYRVTVRCTGIRNSW